jgi:hypothetical protein
MFQMDIIPKLSALLESTSEIDIDEVVDLAKKHKLNIKRTFVEFFIQKPDVEDKYIYNHEKIAEFLGFSDKSSRGYQHFKVLIKRELVETQDYIIIIGYNKDGNKRGGSNKKTFMLTRSACFQACMACSKPISKVIRKFFAECYEILEIYINSKNVDVNHKDQYIRHIKVALDDIDNIDENEDEEKECYYRDKLCNKFKGNKEVKCDFGKVDIVTKKSIIEVKNVKLWKHAFGQILAYSRYFPNKKKKIALFGDESYITDDIINTLYQYDVNVIFIN